MNAITDDMGPIWSDVARKISGRTDEECRVRYFNYLKPLLNRNVDWTPNEDALLFYLVNSIGNQWDLISKLLTGKSDVAAKQRYNFIMRKMEKTLTLVRASGDREAGEISPILDSQDMRRQVRAAVDAIINLRSSTSTLPSDWCYDYEFEFGPYFLPSVVQDTFCRRCALAVPSPQTGRKVCKKTGALPSNGSLITELLLPKVLITSLLLMDRLVRIMHQITPSCQ